MRIQNQLFHRVNSKFASNTDNNNNNNNNSSHRSSYRAYPAAMHGARYSSPRWLEGYWGTRSKLGDYTTIANIRTPSHC